MRVVQFEAGGFRSIRHLPPLELGTINVLYGKNGAGKSNFLAAIDRFWSLFRSLVLRRAGSGPAAIDASLIRENDFSRGSREMYFRAQVELGEGELVHDGCTTTTFGCTIRVTGGPDGVQAEVETLRADVRDVAGSVSTLTVWPEVTQVEGADGRRRADSAGTTAEQREAWRSAAATLLESSWLLLPEIRGVPRARSAVPPGQDRSPAARLSQLALNGCLEEALFLAKNSPDLSLEERVEALRRALQDPPFERPEFRVALDGERLILQEILDVGGKRTTVPLDLAGLGVRQIYAILGGILLSGARMVAVEEPEAHLHEPSTGLQLRQALLGLLSGTLSQLFIATHSTLFDLDPTGYLDVRLDPTLGTVIERRTDLVNVDRHHAHARKGTGVST